MIEWIIRRSVANRFLVMMAALFLSIWGTWTIIHTPVDALPDLSDVQVIVKTRYPGQAPQIVENQVTWPLTTTMLSVPGAKTVRGFSQFGDSYVYVIFEDGTDPYWARSRVLEYLNGTGQTSRRGQRRNGPGRHRRRLGLRVRAGRPQRQARPRRTALPTGLVLKI